MRRGSTNVKARCGGPATKANDFAMGKADEDRAKRLAEALRQNLRKRKAQARGDAPLPEAEGEKPHG